MELGMDRNYDKELSDLADRLSHDEHLVVVEGSRDFESLFDRLTSLYLMYRYLVERGIANQAPKAVRILYAKLANCLVGVLHLLQAGYPGPAAMLLRSLFETAVHLQVLLKDEVKARCELFEDYVFIQRNRSSQESYISDQQKAENAKQLERVKSNYHPTHPNSWCWKVVPSKKVRKNVPENPTFKELCAHIDHPEYYDVYGGLSDAIHPVPTYEVWMRKRDGSMASGSHFGPQVGAVAQLAIPLAGDSLIRVIQFLKPEDETNLSWYVALLVKRPDDASR